MDRPKKEMEHPIFGHVISSYSQAEAIQDGVLVFTGYVGKQRVVFTRNLFLEGYEDEFKRRQLVDQGVELICQEHHEDSPEMRLRVIEQGKIWVIWHIGEGFTFLKPEDY